MAIDIYTPAQLYKITHIPTGLLYYGSCWKNKKTYIDRFKEHLDGKGGVYIKKLIDGGAAKEDFQVEILGVYLLEECLEREKELAMTSLFPKGLNGNAGKSITHTLEVRQKIKKSVQIRIENGTHNFLDPELRGKVEQINKERFENGTHPFLSGDIQRSTQNRLVENGTHNFLSGDLQRITNKKRIENGTHNFLDHEFQDRVKQINKERIENGTHHFLGCKINKKRIENGTHNFLDKEKASQRQKLRVKNGTHNFLNANQVTALNIETGIIANIPKELYRSRKDIYFHPASKLFKEWKNKEKKVGQSSC